MKKIAVVILLALFQIAVVNAQGRFSPKERAKDLKDKLELTDDQAKKVEAIYQESTDKVKELRDNNSGDRTELMKVLKPINENTEKRIDSLLTDKQKEQYAKLKKERAAARQERRARPQN